MDQGYQYQITVPGGENDGKHEVPLLCGQFSLKIRPQPRNDHNQWKGPDHNQTGLCTFDHQTMDHGMCKEIAKKLDLNIETSVSGVLWFTDYLLKIFDYQERWHETCA